MAINNYARLPVCALVCMGTLLMWHACNKDKLLVLHALCICSVITMQKVSVNACSFSDVHMHLPSHRVEALCFLARVVFCCARANALRIARIRICASGGENCMQELMSGLAMKF